MSIRSLVLVSVVVSALSLATSARADVPNPSTGSGGSTSTSASSSSGTTGAGGGLATDPNCSVAQQETEHAGATCEACAFTGAGSATTPACSSLGNTYYAACQSSSSVQVWCNGPQTLAPSDQNVAQCSVAVPGGSWSCLGGFGALAAAAALLMRRRRS
jgi:MYXO-CTERM domain-containing protein